MPYSNQPPSIAEENWHSLKETEIFKLLDSSFHGLTTKEAEIRLSFYGKNKLPGAKKITLLQIVLHQLISPLIFILILAAIASLFIGEAKDAIFIFLVIIINSSLGAYQEYNAEKSAEGLQKLLKIQALVKRNKKNLEMDSEEVVPGDIIMIESGLKIPADLRLLQAFNLSIDESFLTGESEAVKKKIDIMQTNISIGERHNMAFAGSTVMSGHGLGMVVATGINTQVGQIASNLSTSTSAKPPLVLRMEKFIKQIAFIIIAISVLIAIVLKINGLDTATIFFLVVALAVSAIPEGLPVAFTMALSIATKRMLKRNVIVRRLTAVESLGSCTVIASDKTGTLTVNKQTAKFIILPNGHNYSVSGEGYNDQGEVFLTNEPKKSIGYKKIDAQLLDINRIAVLANEAELKNENGQWLHHGDAIDVALLALSHKLGMIPKKVIADYKIIDTIPYESEKAFSATFFQENGSINIAMKGAVETVLNFCYKIKDGKNRTEINKDEILQHAESLAIKGYRVLAFAQGNCRNFEKKDEYITQDIPKLDFYGLICFIDPLRPEAKKAVEKCKQAGIKVIMITGDHPATAKTIAQEIGIINEKTDVVTGQMLSAAGPPDSQAFENFVTSTTVFARVSPTQKFEIIDVLIRTGEFVAVTGDGVNDAPALKRANIGVAMGSGTDVAKEVSSMIVIDDNFSSIVAGVEEGRFAYNNIRKVIYLLISTATGLIFLFITSIILGLPIPFLAVQLLWLNLVTNGIQDVALAFESGEPGAMKKYPRHPSETIFNNVMIKQTIVSGLAIGSIVLGAWYWLNRYSFMSEHSARNILLLLMVLIVNFHVFNCRSEYTSAFKIPLSRNKILVFGVIIAQGIHILSMQIPIMQDILRLQPITFQQWIKVLILAIPILIIMELYKKIFNKQIINT